MSLRVENLSKRYRDVAALENCSLEIAERELVAIVGPSGCGKTTLLRIVAGLLTADSGTVQLEGRPLDGLPPRDRHVSFIMQHLALYPHMTVEENIGYPLRVRRLPRGVISEKVRSIAALVGISSLLARYPSQMSGGQNQRVAVARALIRDDAKLLLADEPLSDLDAQLRYQFRPEFKRLQRERGLPCVFVTHDQEEALAIGDRVAVMHGGRVVQIGDPHQLYQEPINTFVAGFIGRPPMNLLSGVLRNGSITGPFVGALRAQVRGNGDVLVGFRSEELSLAESGTNSGTPAEIRLIESTGADTLVHVSNEAETAVVRVRGRFIAREGDSCQVIFPRSATRIFDKASGMRVSGNATTS